MFSFSQAPVVLILSLAFVLNLGQCVTITVDVETDVKTPNWVNECFDGYHELETFTCDGSTTSVIPAVDYNGSKGYWTRCSDNFVPICNLIYRPNATEILKEIRVQAYFVGDSSIEVVIETSTGFTTRLFDGKGWQTVSIDMSGLNGFKEIIIAPEYHGNYSFTIIDKIILDDTVTITTTSTTPAPTTTGASTTVPPTSIAPSSAPPTTTPPTSTPPPTTTPPSTPPPTTTLPPSTTTTTAAGR